MNQNPIRLPHSKSTRQKSRIFNRYAMLPLLITVALYSNHSLAALTAVTSQTIKGNAPELSAALQAEIASNTFSLFNLVATDSSGGKTTYTADTDPNFIAKINGITQLGQKTLNDIAAALANDTTGTLSGGFSAPQAGDATDIDGDSNYSMTGTTTAYWYYDNLSGTPVKITNPNNRSLCAFAAAGQTPYIKIGASNLKLLTQYGDPPDNNYSATLTKNYNLPTPFACFAKPNLAQGTGKWAGPANVWNPSYGFIPQDISTPHTNFPTTGSNNLSFYLTTVGTTSAAIIGASTGLSQGNITVALSADDQTPARPNILKVTLTGPKDGSTGTSSAVSLPAEFKLKAPLSGGGTVDIYSFAISKWFIAKLGFFGDYPAAQSYCQSFTGYNVPSQADYVNQFHGGFTPGTTWGGNLTRDISGALFSEWGWTSNTQAPYTTSDWNGFYYWVRETFSATYQYSADNNNGHINYSPPSGTFPHVGCISL